MSAVRPISAVLHALPRVGTPRMPFAPRGLAAIAAVTLCATLSGCGLTYMVGKAAVTVPGDLAARGNHAAASSAMERGDVDAAIGLLSDTRFNMVDKAQVRGRPGWSGVYYQAATLVARANDDGRQIDDEVLLTSYQILARDYDYAVAARYLALARPLVVKRYGPRSMELLELVLDDRLILLSYFKAGGAINQYGTLGEVTLMDMLDARARPNKLSLSYDPDLLLSFPMRLSREDRELFFEMGRFTLLPRSQWHDPAAFKRVLATQEYLWWLEEWRSFSVYWRLTRALNEFNAPASVCWARSAGYKVIPHASAKPAEVDPPGCLSR
ncbi:hypothetical protein ACILG0_08875 [Pseudomonadota bacterium AL_CKDN230030165-1A_HGKHYDSX7]